MNPLRIYEHEIVVDNELVEILIEIRMHIVFGDGKLSAFVAGCAINTVGMTAGHYADEFHLKNWCLV